MKFELAAFGTLVFAITIAILLNVTMKKPSSGPSAPSGGIIPSGGTCSSDANAPKCATGTCTNGKCPFIQSGMACTPGGLASCDTGLSCQGGTCQPVPGSSPTPSSGGSGGSGNGGMIALGVIVAVVVVGGVGFVIYKRKQGGGGGTGGVDVDRLFA